MAQNITLLGANYPDVPAVQLPITGGGTATFSDTRSVTYNLTGGATAFVTPSEVVTGQGFSVKLKAPIGYSLSGVTVTMGGVDITSQVFTPDASGGGGGVTITEEANATGTTCAITTGSTPTPEPSETWETLIDGTFSTDNGAFWVTALGEVYPTIGSEWRITLDGDAYRCTAVGIQNQWGSTEIYVGNPVWAGYSDDGTGVPFAFINKGYGAWNGYSEVANGNHSLKVEQLVT